jgi:hypothetical protein
MRRDTLNPQRDAKLHDRRRLRYGQTRKPNAIYCDFCGLEDHWRRTRRQIYAPMLRLDVWAFIAKRRVHNVMCLSCMLRKLGRPLNPRWDYRDPWWLYETLPSERERRMERRLKKATQARLAADGGLT